MRRVNIACIEAGGRTVEVTTHDINRKEGVSFDGEAIVIKSGLDLPPARAAALQRQRAVLVARDMYERNYLFENFGDAALWTPGGIGSLLEAAIWAQYTQLGYQDKVLAMLDVDRIHKPMQKALKDQVRWGLVDQAEFDRIFVFHDFLYRENGDRGKISEDMARGSINEYLDRVEEANELLVLASQAREQTVAL